MRTTTATTTTTKPMYCDPKACTASVQRAAAFSLKLENQKCLNFHRSNHFSQNLLRNKAETSCNLQSHSNTNVQPGASPKLHRLVLVQSQMIHISRQELCTISKLKKGAALRVPDKSLLYLEQRQKKGNPCWYSEQPKSAVFFFSRLLFCDSSHSSF